MHVACVAAGLLCLLLALQGDNLSLSQREQAELRHNNKMQRQHYERPINPNQTKMHQKYHSHNKRTLRRHQRQWSPALDSWRRSAKTNLNLNENRTQVEQRTEAEALILSGLSILESYDSLLNEFAEKSRQNEKPIQESAPDQDPLAVMKPPRLQKHKDKNQNNNKTQRGHRSTPPMIINDQVVDDEIRRRFDSGSPGARSTSPSAPGSGDNDEAGQRNEVVRDEDKLEHQESCLLSVDSTRPPPARPRARFNKRNHPAKEERQEARIRISGESNPTISSGNDNTDSNNNNNNNNNCYHRRRRRINDANANEYVARVSEVDAQNLHSGHSKSEQSQLVPDCPLDSVPNSDSNLDRDLTRDLQPDRRRRHSEAGACPPGSPLVPGFIWNVYGRLRQRASQLNGDEIELKKATPSRQSRNANESAHMNHNANDALPLAKAPREAGSPSESDARAGHAREGRSSRLVEQMPYGASAIYSVRQPATRRSNLLLWPTRNGDGDSDSDSDSTPNSNSNSQGQQDDKTTNSKEDDRGGGSGARDSRARCSWTSGKETNTNLLVQLSAAPDQHSSGPSNRREPIEPMMRMNGQLATACDLSERLLPVQERSQLCFWFPISASLSCRLAGTNNSNERFERLIEAELHLFKLRPLSSGQLMSINDTSRSRPRSHQEPDADGPDSTANFERNWSPPQLKTNLLEVSLYQILPAPADSISGHQQSGAAVGDLGLRLLDIRRMDLHSSGWETFYVKRALEDWLRDPASNLGLVIKTKSMFEEPVRIGLIRFADLFDSLTLAPARLKHGSRPHHENGLGQSDTTRSTKTTATDAQTDTVARIYNHDRHHDHYSKRAADTDAACPSFGPTHSDLALQPTLVVYTQSRGKQETKQHGQQTKG